MELSLNSLYNLESQLIPETCLDECRLLPMFPPCPTLGGLSGLRAPDLGGSNVPTEKENHSSQSRLLSTTFSMLALPWQTDRFSRNGRGNGNGNMGYFRPPQNQPGSWATFNLFELLKQISPLELQVLFWLVHRIAEEKGHGLEQLGSCLIGPPFPNCKSISSFS